MEIFRRGAKLGGEEGTSITNCSLLHSSVPVHRPAARWLLFCPPLLGISGHNWQLILPGLEGPLSLHLLQLHSQSEGGSAPPESSHNLFWWRPKAGNQISQKYKHSRTHSKDNIEKGKTRQRERQNMSRQACVQKRECKRRIPAPLPETPSAFSINVYMKEAKKPSNFNEKKNRNQILLQHKAEAKKLILSCIIAPK